MDAIQSCEITALPDSLRDVHFTFEMKSFDSLPDESMETQPRILDKPDNRFVRRGTDRILSGVLDQLLPWKASQSIDRILGTLANTSHTQIRRFLLLGQYRWFSLICQIICLKLVAGINKSISQAHLFYNCHRRMEQSPLCRSTSSVWSLGHPALLCL